MRVGGVRERETDRDREGGREEGRGGERETETETETENVCVCCVWRAAPTSQTLACWRLQVGRSANDADVFVVVWVPGGGCLRCGGAGV